MYGDIAILCRTGTYFGLFEDAMRAHNIPYITTAGRGYFNRPEVTDLIGLLSALYNDADHLALAAVLRSPLFSLSDSALYALRKAGDSLWGVLTADVPPDDFPADELPALDFARSVLSDLKTRTRRARIADILREALEATHYLAFLESQAHGIQSRANVQKLVEQAETSGVVTLSQFLNYIEQVKSAEARESDAALDAENAVQLMTIHASKGLEFKVVFLPMTNDHTNQDNEVVKAHPILGLVCKLPNRDGDSFKPFPFRHAKHIKQAKEDAEALRLFYVAATRVKNLLILSGSYNVSKDGKIGSTGRMSHLLDHQPTLTGTHGTHVSYSDITARVLPRTAHAIGGRTLPQIDDSIIPVTPPLFHTIPSRVIDRAKHVTTTDLSHLSQSRNAPTAEERKQAGGRFRRGVLGQSDSPIRFLTAGIQSSRAPSRVVGEVVHEAIRFGYDSEADDELRALLQSLVWSQPIGPDLHADAVARALDLIGRYRQSTLSNDIHLSPTVYREIPFVYDLNDIIIHGQIDLLYRDAHRVWTLVDYKTDYIPRGGDIRTHSQRHLTQLAVYARAVRERLNLTQDAQTLQVKLHYLSVNTTVDLSDTELESALIGGLSALVSQTLTQEDDHA
jgi:ATP-dependent exoDNAse (exonuclease V) beta subunit